MCGIIGYKGKKNGCEVVLNGLKDLEYRGYDSWGIAASNFSKTINNNFGHVRWAMENFIKHKNSYNLKHSNKRDIGMNILNLVKKENYYVLISKDFQNILNEKIINKKETVQNVNISRRTLYRMTKKENYWCNIQTLFNLISDLDLSEDELLKNIEKIKTKNSFPISTKKINTNSKQFFRILGHILGDGGIHVIENEGKYRAFYVNNEQKLLDSFHNDIKKTFGEFKIYSRKRVGHGDEIWLPSTVGFTLYTLLNYKELNKKKRIPDLIFNTKNKGLLGAFLQAFYDDDGFIYPKKNMIVIAQKSKKLVEDIRKIVTKIGIKPNQLLIHKSKSRTTMYYFSITHKDNFKIFDEFVGFKHPKKKEKLKLLMNKYKEI
ncbi:MAG: hypothetical protein KJ597_03885 [Nanoarchaeota archaeon]|nr:hypothetical protein [Nanoarchaeota archaeon]MBU1622687.1 hypothetical protein [Nanoarchaeota archaeon]